jgi:hypothetical protein
MIDGYKAIKKIYKEKLGIPSRVVDLISISDILKHFVCGLSNKAISSLLSEDEEYVRQVLVKTFNFEGFSKDLDISLILVYNKSMGNVVDFRNNILELTEITDDADIINYFNYCHKYDMIRKEIERYDR